MQINQTKQNLKNFTIMKTLKSTLLLLALGATTFLTSCDKDKKDPDPRDAFVGTYDLEGKGNCKGDEYSMKITKDPKSATGLIIDFEYFDDLNQSEVSAELKGSTLEAESFEVSGEIDGTPFEAEISGEGRVSGKTLTFTVGIESNIGDDECDFVGDKK
jgi:hypothetical protein